MDHEKVLLTPMAVCYAFGVSADALRHARAREKHDGNDIGYELRLSDKPVFLVRLPWAKENWKGTLSEERLEEMTDGALEVTLYAHKYRDRNPRHFDAIIIHRTPVLELEPGMPANVDSAWKYAADIGEEE